MFIHKLKYEILQCLRSKDVLLWMILFPIILGAFFKIAFGDMYEKQTAMVAIPVAVVEQKENKNFKETILRMSEGEDAMFSTTYENEADALKLLEEKKVYALIYVNDKLSARVNTSGVSSFSTEQTIIKRFLEQYQVYEQIIVDTIQNHPEKMGDVMEQLSKEVNCNRNIKLTDGNVDLVLPFFYNLIAMVALLGSSIGLHIAINRQGNLSHIGARICCSPTNRLISIIAGFLGSFLTQTICIIISISYLAFVLKVDFGPRLPMVYLVGILGGMLGIAFGFFIGAIGTIKENTKEAICTVVSLGCCFFSGLMVSNMKRLVEDSAPWFNRINPAALISDSFYCLNIYEDDRVLMIKLITMIIMTVVFIFAGFLMTRRQRYASI